MTMTKAALLAKLEPYDDDTEVFVMGAADTVWSFDSLGESEDGERVFVLPFERCPQHEDLEDEPPTPVAPVACAKCGLADVGLLCRFMNETTFECYDRAACARRVCARQHPGVAMAASAPTAWADQPTPEDGPISEAFPTRSGRHDLYQEAMRLVGARHSKGALVSLVNWLLLRAEPKRREITIKEVDVGCDACAAQRGTRNVATAFVCGVMLGVARDHVSFCPPHHAGFKGAMADLAACGPREDT